MAALLVLAQTAQAPVERDMRKAGAWGAEMDALRGNSFHSAMFASAVEEAVDLTMAQ